MDPDDDDPEVEEAWCCAMRATVAEYLAAESVVHGTIGDWPAWHVAPIVSIWAIESVRAPGSVGWWVVCGDLPTDYLSADGRRHPRAALAAFAERWSNYVAACEQGRPPGDFVLGDGSPELLELLKGRAETLASWARDDELWRDS